jgi:hypothetical protein
VVLFSCKVDGYFHSKRNVDAVGFAVRDQFFGSSQVAADTGKTNLLWWRGEHTV